MDTVVTPPTSESKPKRKLLDQVREVMRLKHYSLRTERTYCDWGRALYPLPRDASPGEMAEPEAGEEITPPGLPIPEGKRAAFTTEDCIRL
jgi:hypothetical protein